MPEGKAAPSSLSVPIAEEPSLLPAEFAAVRPSAVQYCNGGFPSVEYQQGAKDFCLSYSGANAFHEAGYVDAAALVAKQAKRVPEGKAAPSSLSVPIAEAPALLSAVSSAVRPSDGQCVNGEFSSVEYQQGAKDFCLSYSGACAGVRAAFKLVPGKKKSARPSSAQRLRPKRPKIREGWALSNRYRCWRGRGSSGSCGGRAERPKLLKVHQNTREIFAKIF